jgi:uncharacterized protein YycO
MRRHRRAAPGATPVAASDAHASGVGTACGYVRCGPGEVIADLRPADIILIRGRGWLGRLIRAAAWVRYRKDDRRYAHWSHAALVLSASGHLVEVRAGGVGICGIEKFRDQEFHYVRLELADHGRWEAVRYAVSCVGKSYSVSGFILLGLSVVFGDWLRVPDKGQQGCVALIARALQRAGIAFDRAPPDMMPADLAKQFNVMP